MCLLETCPTGAERTLSGPMDAHLKLLADVALHVSAAEEALAEGASISAAGELDAADAGLAELRERWPSMPAFERTLVGRTAAPVRQRLDEARARLPRRSALSEGAAEHDAEEEVEPAA
ncbi:MAG: hypothetical protein JWO74_3522 [Solirubrobacterales bacterium]|nr:hypothetical protein [Solirubrobacterales bacterium]